MLLVNREAEVRSGVVMSEEVVVESGRNVAMETRLLGWKTCVVDGAGGLTAMETLLGLARSSMFLLSVLAVFSFPSMEALCPVLFDSRGDG